MKKFALPVLAFFALNTFAQSSANEIAKKFTEENQNAILSSNYQNDFNSEFLKVIENDKGAILLIRKLENKFSKDEIISFLKNGKSQNLSTKNDFSEKSLNDLRELLLNSRQRILKICESLYGNISDFNREDFKARTSNFFATFMNNPACAGCLAGCYGVYYYCLEQTTLPDWYCDYERSQCVANCYLSGKCIDDL